MHLGHLGRRAELHAAQLDEAGQLLGVELQAPDAGIGLRDLRGHAAELAPSSRSWRLRRLTCWGSQLRSGRRRSLLLPRLRAWRASARPGPARHRGRGWRPAAARRCRWAAARAACPARRWRRAARGRWWCRAAAGPAAGRAAGAQLDADLIAPRRDGHLQPAQRQCGIGLLAQRGPAGPAPCLAGCWQN